MSDIVETIEAVIEATFAPAVNFKAPYARLMREKAAVNILSALEAEGWAVVRRADGSDDFLSAPVPASSWPTGDKPAEDWAVLDPKPSLSSGITHAREPYEGEED